MLDRPMRSHLSPPIPPAAPPAAGRAAAAGRLTILGVDVDRLDRGAARLAVRGLAAGPGHHCLSFVNAHALTLAARDARYRVALAQSSLVLNDGLGLALAARASGRDFPANLNGSDLLPLLLADFATAGHRVFFYGAAPGVAAHTAARWRARIPGLTVAGSLDGFTVSGAAAAEIIRRAGADVVLVALGNPRQELWAQAMGPRTGARLTVGVGAFFDFSAGVVRRAPLPIRRVRMEWAFRLAQEPRRLGRRYVVGIPEFLVRVGAHRLRASARPTPAFPAAIEPAARRHPSAGRSVPAVPPVHLLPPAEDAVAAGAWSNARAEVERAG